MARTSAKDPLDKFRWAVTVEGFTRLGFSSCETPSLSVNTQNYPEGGSHLWPRKIIDSVEYKPVALQRGVTSDFNFHEWAIQFMELYKGQRDNTYKTGGQAQQGPQYPPGEYRRTVRIDHLDRAGRIVKTYILHKAFPIEYKPASDFSADGDDLLSMERLVLAYESFEVQGNPNSTDTNPVDSRDLIKRLTNRLF